MILQEGGDLILQTLLQTLIQVLVPILTGVLIILGKRALDYVTAQMDQKELEFAKMLIDNFVLAAEQNGLSDALLAEGEAKKEWVILQTESALANHGIELDVHILAEMIEAAVMQEFNKKKVP